jgi:phosphate uptake regulator
LAFLVVLGLIAPFHLFSNALSAIAKTPASPKLIPILKEQVRLVLEDSLKSFEGKRKDLLSQITQKENELENLERRFAVGQINEKMWKKYTRITQEEIKEIELKLENLPSKK